MPTDLEERLERLAETFPLPTAESREGAQRVALAALRSPERPRRRTGVLLTAGAITAAAAAAVTVVVAPWRESPLATERALAALGEQPIVHAIVEGSARAETRTLIDLASGETVREFYRTEYWYDEERETLRAGVTIGDRRLMEILDSPQGFFSDRGSFPGARRSSPRLDPALAGFVTGYREALEEGEAHVVGEETVDGRKAIVLRISLRPGPLGEEHWEEVAIDATEYRPLRFRFSWSGGAPGTTTPWSRANRVVEIETIPREPRDFVRPESEPRPTERIGADTRTVDRAEAVAALEGRAVWSGRAVDGADLRQMELTRITSRWTDGRVTQTHLLHLQYGAAPSTGPRGRWLVISEGTSAEETPRVSGHEPPPAPGKLRLIGFEGGDGDADIWFGSMQVGGVYISMHSPQRDLILAAARAMVPLR